MKVNVLGIDYEVMTNVSEDDDPKIVDCDGYCDFTTKQIKIAEMIPDDRTYKDLKVYERRTIRHELIHAFLFESGLDHNTWGRNEEIVDWIAIQFPKMNKAFEEGNVKV